MRAVAGDHEVGRAAAWRAQQLHERHVELAVERLQVADLERLHEHVRVALVEVVAFSARTSGSSSGRPIERKYVGCLVSG